MPGADQTNAELVRAFFETLSTGDLERVRPLFHEDATWRVMAGGIPGAGTHVGRDVIVDEFLAPVRGMFVPGDPKVVIDNLIAEGPLVAVEARGQGRFADGRDTATRTPSCSSSTAALIRSLREYLDSFYISTLV